LGTPWRQKCCVVPRMIRSAPAPRSRSTPAAPCFLPTCSGAGSASRGAQGERGDHRVLAELGLLVGVEAHRVLAVAVEVGEDAVEGVGQRASSTRLAQGAQRRASRGGGSFSYARVGVDGVPGRPPRRRGAAGALALPIMTDGLLLPRGARVRRAARRASRLGRGRARGRTGAARRRRRARGRGAGSSELGRARRPARPRGPRRRRALPVPSSTRRSTGLPPVFGGAEARGELGGLPRGGERVVTCGRRARTAGVGGCPGWT
jgi:hypothetical protein